MGFQSVKAAQPFVKGSFAHIQSQYQDKDYLIVFWGQDCAYCMKELASLGPILKANPKIQLVTVSTDSFQDVAYIKEKMAEFDLSDAEHWVFSSDYPETLYFDVNRRWRGELPFTYLSHEPAPIFKRGLMTEEDIHEWLATLH